MKLVSLLIWGVMDKWNPGFTPDSIYSVGHPLLPLVILFGEMWDTLG